MTSWAAVMGLALALPVAPGCRRGGEPDTASARAENVHRYAVRGEITHLATAREPRRITLRHEAIPDFRDEAGDVVGMPSMVMPFDVAAGVALGELRVGDPVEVRFAVSWSPSSLKIEELRKLPAGTELTFGETR